MGTATLILAGCYRKNLCTYGVLHCGYLTLRQLSVCVCVYVYVYVYQYVALHCVTLRAVVIDSHVETSQIK